MRVLFRADSSLEIGSGHVRRCLALAAGLSKKGATCVFVARSLPGNASELVRVASHQLVELTGSASQDTDAAETASAVAALAPFDLVVLDHYGLNREWEDAARKLGRRLAVIDDLADRAHDCDVLVDVAPVDDHAARYEALIPPHALTLLGPRYALLRPEFQALRQATRPRQAMQRALISFGANDVANHSLSAYRATRQVAGIDIDVDIVVGGQAPHRSALAEAIRSDPRARLHIDTQDMAGLMASADLAIGAGGTTSWERACLGLPAITTVVADNQKDTITALAEAGAAVSVPPGADYESRLGHAIASLAADSRRLAAMSEAASSLVDGKGAERVAAVLLRPDVALRDAEATDRRDLWIWRNEPDVRQASNDPSPIAWETHCAWFDAALRDPERRLLVGEATGAAVGVLRFDFASDEATISIYLTPQGHGRGIGPELLMQGEAWLQRNRPGTKRITAQIRPGNQASIAAFSAARYRRENEHYVRDLLHDVAKTH